MKVTCLKVYLLLPLLYPFAASSQATPARNSSVGYPSVAAALADLRNKPGVKIAVQRGWTIAHDSEAHTVWSFTPPNHPAHPAVVKRQIIKENEAVKFRMNALCQAEKAACDALMAKFQELNRRTLGQKEKPNASFLPTKSQIEQSDRTAALFLSAIDEARYREAYSRMTSGLQSLMSYGEFVKHEENLKSKFGGSAVRFDRKITWYKDPPRAQAKGVFAALDYKCRYRNAHICSETLILHEYLNGTFQVMRHERNFIDKEAEKKLRTR